MEKIKIRIIRKKSLGVFPSILVGLIFAGLFSTAVYVFALPYSPGETTNPTCGPTDTNCTVTASAAYSFGSNNFSGSGNFTTTGTGQFGSIAFTTAIGVGSGGTGLGSIAAGSILGANTLNSLSAITSTSGTKVLTNTNGTISWETSSGSGTPGGSNTQVQYNNNGAFGGSANLTFDGTTLTAGGFTTTGVGTFGSASNVSQLVIKANASQSNANPLARFYKSDGTTELLRIHSDDVSNLFIGADAGKVNNITGVGLQGLENTFVGGGSGRSNTTGTGNLALGANALYTNAEGINNIAIGSGALHNNTASYNTVVGNGSLYYNTTGDYNVIVGGDAVQYSSGSSNTVIGYDAGNGTVNNSFDNNTLIGYGSGVILSTGSNNVLIGYQTGINLTTGSGNIIIGYDVYARAATSTQTLNIGNLIFGTGLDGSGTTLSTGNIGIGVTAPTAALHLKAGTATANTAPLKFTSGTSLATAEAGAMEFTTDTLYFTTTTGPTRQTIYMTGGTDVLLADGGTGASLTAVNGGIVYSTASALAISAAGSAGQILRSGGAGAPAWSTPTFPNAATTTGAYLRADGTNFIQSTLLLPNAGTAYKLAAYTATDTLSELAAVGATGTILTGVTGAIPVWTTATYPATTTINQILYSSAANVITGLATVNSGVLVTGATGIPSIATSIPTAVTIGGAYITRVGGTDVVVADGGTGRSVTTAYALIAGGTTTTAAMQSIANSASTGAILQSAGTSVLPAWTTTTYPATTTINQILYSTATNVVSGGAGLTYDGTTLIAGTGTEVFTVLSTGNVGIGATTPTNAKLVVIGGISVGADALNNTFNTASGGTGTTTMYIGTYTINVTAPSDISVKENIVNTGYGLADLMKFSVKNFEYKKKYVDEGEQQEEHTGLIAQEVEEIYPEAIIYRSDNLKAIEYDKLIPLIIKSIQDLASKGVSGALSETGALGTGQIEGVENNSFAAQLKSAFVSLGVYIEKGIVTMEELIAQKATIKTAQIEGLEMVDKATGDVYCTWIENGEWQKTKGECGAINPNAQTPNVQNTATPTVPTPNTQNLTPITDQTQQVVQQAQEIVQQAQQAANNALETTENARQAVEEKAQQVVQQAAETASNVAKQAIKDVKEELKQEIKQELQQEAQPIETPTPTQELTPTPVAVPEQPVEQPSVEEQAPSVGDIIRDAGASLLNSVWQFTKQALQASLQGQGAVKLVPNGIKSFSARLSSFVVQDVKSDFSQLFSQIKAIIEMVKH